MLHRGPQQMTIMLHRQFRSGQDIPNQQALLSPGLHLQLQVILQVVHYLQAARTSIQHSAVKCYRSKDMLRNCCAL